LSDRELRAASVGLQAIARQLSRKAPALRAARR